MNSRERVLAAIRHENPDRCPMDFGGTNFAGCNSRFLAELRKVLGFELPDDRDPGDDYVDEQIQQYLRADIRLVPARADGYSQAY